MPSSDDSTRVELKNCAYINASWVDHKKYIAAQGPLDCSLRAFWEVILEHNVKNVIMLCKLEEIDCYRLVSSADQTTGIQAPVMRVKCARYWPQCVKETLFFGTVYSPSGFMLTDLLLINSPHVDIFTPSGLMLTLFWSPKSETKAYLSRFRIFSRIKLQKFFNLSMLFNNTLLVKLKIQFFIKLFNTILYNYTILFQ